MSQITELMLRIEDLQEEVKLLNGRLEAKNNTIARLQKNHNPLSSTLPWTPTSHRKANWKVIEEQARMGSPGVISYLQEYAIALLELLDYIMRGTQSHLLPQEDQHGQPRKDSDKTIEGQASHSERTEGTIERSEGAPERSEGSSGSQREPEDSNRPNESH
ncbi:hypothetical protein KAR91_24565 [Candidatus Pacearchaeota archaeon]|nr:hypothetical protein [Candidatus Pacearchaeota archaeon]